MKKHFTLLLFFHCFQCLFAQELIYNGSFEEANLCSEFKQECSPAAWYSTSFELNSFGYMQHPIRAKHGRHYVFYTMEGVLGFDYEKSYLQTKLLCSLVKGKKYRLTFQLKRLDKDSFQRVGILLTNQKIENQTVLIGKNKAQHFIYEKDFNQKFKHGKWRKATFIFTADSTYSHLILGNFDIYEPMTMKRGRHHNKDIKYFIDAVSLQPLEQTELCDDYNRNISFLKNDKKRHSSVTQKNERILNLEIAKDSLKIIDKTEIFPVFEKPNTKIDTISLPNILFAFDSHTLNPLYDNVLKNALQGLKNTAFERLEIIGHTDNIGKDEYNQRLSFKRAETICNYLIVNDFCAK